MEIIAASNAYRNEVMLIQHQAILTVMHGMLDDPAVTDFGWLDLACGRGQIIGQLEKNLSDDARSKISYTGYDGQNELLSNAAEKAESLKLKSHSFRVGVLSDFPTLISSTSQFDLITFTNTVHEIAPSQIATIIVESLLRLSPTGLLFIYDMESLHHNHLELGAVTWAKTEIQELLRTLSQSLGLTSYVPTVAQWRHTKCNGWNAQIHRNYMGVSNDAIQQRKDEAIVAVRAKVAELLERKLTECRRSLESHTKHKPENQEEVSDIPRLLYDLWGLTRATEAFK
jgi:ubiquinone/menaquinone biosynthesis C-methylase UbiE